jgi:DNA-binding MarR family transcriptional regulator
VNTDEADKHLSLLLSTAGRGLTANQRLILVTYSMLSGAERSGVVLKTGTELAKLLDLDPTVFSRLRRGLIKAGWLEESGNPLGNIRYYRLSEQSTGDQVVVPIRRAAT